jgi:hypothetical protein
MHCARASITIALLLAWAPLAQGQTANDTPDSAAQTRTTIPPRSETPENRPRGLFGEPSFITKGVNLFDRRANRSRGARDGFYVELGNMITGAGWISAGPGYRKLLLNENAIASVSGAVSVRLYRMAQGSIEFPHLAADHIRFGAQTLFRDALQVNFYGLGNDSIAANRSGYRLQTNDVTTYTSVGAKALLVQARIGWLQPVSVASMGRDAVYPDTVALFSERDVPGLTSQPTFLHGDLSIGVDTRDAIGHPTRGGFYQATWSVFTDQTTGINNFQRYEADASHYVPLGSDNWILALHGSAAVSSTTAGHEVPFYMMPNLGGRNARGFTDFRFTDRNMQAYTVESRWRVFAHLDAAAFVDAGGVAPTPRQLTFRDLKPSYGVGIRLHNNKVTMARLDFGHSVEGWHIFFRMNEPFRRTAQSNGWRAAAPYVP